METPNPHESRDRIVWRADLRKELGVSDSTVRRLIIKKVLPDPDVDLSRQTKGWRMSTLRAAGINLP